MDNLMSWDTGNGKMPIVEGNPGEESNYAKWHGFNAWEDDI